MAAVFRRAAAGVASLLAFMAVTAAATPRIVGVEVKGPFLGTCMASAVVAYPPGTVDQFMIVGNDETNKLQTYRVTDGRSQALHTADLNTFFGLNDAKTSLKIDIEAATYLGSQAVWIGSHSRNSDGELRSARTQLFTTDIVLLDGVPRAQSAQKIVERSLLEAFADVDALRDIVAIDRKEVPTLAAKKDGLNIEGLSVAADGTSLVVGLRGPLPGGSAYLLTVSDALGLLRTGKPAPGSVKLAKALQLGAGMGVRSLEYSAARSGYFLVAGPAGPDAERPEFELFLWDGTSDQPEPIPGLRDRITAAGIAKFQPEALAVDATGTRLLILSDDENRCQENSFNGVVVTLSP